MYKKKKWEDFDKPLEFQSYYDEKIEQKVKEIEDKIGKNVFELLGSQEWKITCNRCGLGHTLKFNAKDISDYFKMALLICDVTVIIFLKFQSHLLYL